MKAIHETSQKEGTVDRFILSRCNFIANNNNDCKLECCAWKLLCFEVMYLFGNLSSCNSDTIFNIIAMCEESADKEPIIGLSFFIIAACYNVLRDGENSLLFYQKCIEKCNDNLSILLFPYIPAYANFELAKMHFSLGNDVKTRAYLHAAQQFKNFDFEQRLKLKISSLLSYNS